jgi:hypothetical protein
LGVVCFGTRGEVEDSKNKPTKKSVQIFVRRGWRNKFFTFFKKDAVTSFNNFGFKTVEDYRNIGFYCFNTDGDSVLP